MYRIYSIKRPGRLFKKHFQKEAFVREGRLIKKF